jgi:choline dehydrogenase
MDVERANVLSELRAEREVILCAGTYNFPQIVMLSGVGIAGELQAYGIVPRVDLPVGENLQDHPIIGLWFLTDTETLITAATEENVALLRNEGRGSLTSNIAEAGGFFRTCDGLAGPDFQLYAAPVMFIDEGLALPTEDAFAFAANLLRPTSRGKVFLRSLLPSAKPHILHGYHTTEEDRDAMIRAVRKLLEIAEQPALSEHRRDVSIVGGSGGI